MNIYKILLSKKHNKHYLRRYYKFIVSCSIKNAENCTTLSGTEIHHICPKAKDLFPEYANLKQFPWNKIVLTYRQHYLAHYMLWKAYGGSQIYAFQTMAMTHSPIKIKSAKVYNILKGQHSKHIGALSKGYSSYITPEGITVRCKTDDPKVISGEYVSTSKGRRYAPRSQESKERTTKSLRAHYDNKNPIKEVKLYRGKERIIIKYNVLTENLDRYFNDGWSIRASKEYISHTAKIRATGVKCTEEKKEKLRHAHAGKIRGPKNIEKRIELLKKNGTFSLELYYNVVSGEFVETHKLLADEHEIKVFSSANDYRLVFDIYSNKRACDKRVPTPPGYYEDKPFRIFTIFDLISNCIEYMYFKDITRVHVIVRSPNGGRRKFELESGKVIYLTEEFISKYGIPRNVK